MVRETTKTLLLVKFINTESRFNFTDGLWVSFETFKGLAFFFLWCLIHKNWCVFVTFGALLN